MFKGCGSLLQLNLVFVLLLNILEVMMQYIQMFHFHLWSTLLSFRVPPLSLSFSEEESRRKILLSPLVRPANNGTQSHSNGMHTSLSFLAFWLDRPTDGAKILRCKTRLLGRWQLDIWAANARWFAGPIFWSATLIKSGRGGGRNPHSREKRQ